MMASNRGFKQIIITTAHPVIWYSAVRLITDQLRIELVMNVCYVTG